MQVKDCQTVYGRTVQFKSNRHFNSKCSLNSSATPLSAFDDADTKEWQPREN